MSVAVEYTKFIVSTQAAKLSVSVEVGYNPLYPLLQEEFATDDADLSFATDKVLQTEVVQTTDAFSIAFVPGDFSSVLSSSDNAVLGLNKGLSDTVSVSDSAFSFDLTHRMVDHFWNIDSITFGILWERVLTDTYVSSDPVFKTFVRAPFTDNVSSSDSFSKSPDLYKQETVSYSDSLSRVVSWSRDFIDTSSTLDSLRKIDSAKVLIDTPIITTTFSQNVAKPLTDTVSVVDSAGKGISFILGSRNETHDINGSVLNAFALGDFEYGDRVGEIVVFRDVLDIILDGTSVFNGSALNEAILN